ncbi:MAG: ribonuclease P protein component [Ferruginibacter sp.]
MTTTTRYFLRKEDKLKSRKTIELLFSRGNSFSNFPFKVIWLPENNEAVLQAAVGVSSKSFKKATDRNRIKRLMREAYRLQKKILQDHLSEKQNKLSVFILYVGKELPEYGIVFEKIGIILKRLIKFSDENTKKPA